MIYTHIYSQSHPKSKPWHTKPFPLYDNIAELVDGMHASGEKWAKIKKKKGEEEPGLSSIPIDPVLLAESISQEKLYSDIDSVCDLSSLSLASSHHSIFVPLERYS